MIQIIDYNAGNIRSVANALKTLRQKFEIISDAKNLNPAAKIIFPGVGAAKSAMKILEKRGFLEIIPKIKTPFLGICLGMQLLTSFSEEGNTKCLNVIPGEVKKFRDVSLKIPQIGWNRVFLKKTDNPLLKNIPDNSYFYFVHSYYVETLPKFILGELKYGNFYSSILQKDNFYGVQFHPEKSAETGLKLLNNFCTLC